MRAYWAANPEDRGNIAEAAGLKRVTRAEVPASEEQLGRIARYSSGRCSPSSARTPKPGAARAASALGARADAGEY